MAQKRTWRGIFVGGLSVHTLILFGDSVAVASIHCPCLATWHWAASGELRYFDIDQPIRFGIRRDRILITCSDEEVPKLFGWAIDEVHKEPVFTFQNTCSVSSMKGVSPGVFMTTSFSGSCHVWSSLTGELLYSMSDGARQASIFCSILWNQQFILGGEEGLSRFPTVR